MINITETTIEDLAIEYICGSDETLLSPQTADQRKLNASAINVCFGRIAEIDVKEPLVR